MQLAPGLFLSESVGLSIFISVFIYEFYKKVKYRNSLLGGKGFSNLVVFLGVEVESTCIMSQYFPKYACIFQNMPVRHKKVQ